MKHKLSGIDVEDIKAELRKKYGPLVHISEQFGLSRNAISAVLGNARHSIKTELRVAQLLGKSPYEVWGASRFTPDNKPVKRAPQRSGVKKVPEKLRKMCGKD
ncbi:transcriptional regulator [Aristophania vespae]|uniref:Transcriptional regulator n=1 Tax=Aristophania vespae TaxID=2697033 RepID=A0A6P1NK20_9PROT|nr:helix-turn-helix domain-containing protein [Aristophania vespae]QHI96022.1 transcriptional regulator [Aristophania vespae]UMM63789.1 hypothetical protein DM15PD_07660 [Aristophania vespae]